MPVNFLIISSCTNDATYSRMDDQPTTSRYTKNFVESLSTKDRSILNTASKTYEELIEWWQERKIDNPQKCFEYINYIAHSKIADEDKTRLINTLCAVHPKCLERLQNNDRYINAPNYIIRLLNKKVNWESYQKVENIIKALRACTPSKVNFNAKDEHGNTLLMSLDLSKDLRYTNAIDNLYHTKTSILSNKDKAIRKEAKEEYFKNLRSFENKVLCCYQCRNHLDEILEAQIEPALKSKLISALFETYPNYLHGCENDFNNKAQELANKTMQLLWKNKIQHSGHKRTIVHSLFELGPQKVNFTMTDGDGKNLFIDIAASGDDRYMEECLNTGSDNRFTSKPIIDYTAKDNNGKHVLYYAIDSGNLNVIHRLCENAKNSGIDIVNTTAKDGHCLVTYALAKHPNHIAYQIVLQLIDCNPKTINFALKQAVRGRHYVKTYFNAFEVLQMVTRASRDR